MLSPKKLADTVSIAYATCIEPLLFRFRRRRLRVFGFDSLATLPIADLEFDCRTASCGPDCTRAVKHHQKAFQRFAGVDSSNRGLRGRSSTLAAIDLRKFRDVADFGRQLRSSRFARNIKEARRLGYQAQVFNRNSHIPDIVEIRRSLKWRAFGPVLDAFFLTSRSLGEIPSMALPVVPPTCVQHWGICIGLFLPQPGHRQGNVLVDRKLVAYVVMDRTGNTVSLADGMAHGEHMRRGVMKMLHVAIVDWLLDHRSSLAHGVHFVTYGAIEQGSHGLCVWKQRALFLPYRVRISIPNP